METAISYNFYINKCFKDTIFDINFYFCLSVLLFKLKFHAMKKSILISASLFMMLTSCIKTSGNNGKNGEDGFNISWNSNEGKGPIKEKTISAEFSGVQVSNSIKTEIYKSTENKVVISAPDDILEFIDASVQNDGVMKIGVKKNSSWKNSISTKKVLVKVFAKNLESLRASSSGEIFLKDKFSGENMVVKASSSGEIHGDLEYNTLSIEVSSSGDYSGKIWADTGSIRVSSSGDVKVEGKIQNADIQASSSGDINGANLEIKRGSVQASSSADVKVMVSDKISAQASSSASINILKIGNPEITKTSSSSGSVNVK